MPPCSATVALGPLGQFGGGPPAGGLLDQPVLGHDGVVAVLLMLSLAATAAGLLFRRDAGADVERWLWLAASGAFVVTALFLAPLAADRLTGATVLVLAVVCFAASHLERWPVLYVPAVAAVLAGATLAVAGLLEAVPGAVGQLPAVAGGLRPGGGSAVRRPLGAPRCAGRRSGPAPGAGGCRRSWALASPRPTGCGGTGPRGPGPRSWPPPPRCAARKCRRQPAGPVRNWDFLPRRRRCSARCCSPDSAQAPGGPMSFWTLQWYVILAGALGALRLMGPAGRATRAGRMLLSGGAGLLTLSGLGIVVGGDAGQQLWVLALMAVVLMAGLGFGERLFVWWGASGVALCIMWAMRQYTFALLALIAAALIALAVWRLNRSRPCGDEPAPWREPADHS